MSAYATINDLANAATEGWRELAQRGAPEAVLDSALLLMVATGGDVSGWTADEVAVATTALALIAGSSVILFDPIFQGMAISLMFGVFVSTLLTLVVIPLGCISGRQAFCPTTIDIHGLRHSLCDGIGLDEAQKARDYDFVEMMRSRWQRFNQRMRGARKPASAPHDSRPSPGDAPDVKTRESAALVTQTEVPPLSAEEGAPEQAQAHERTTETKNSQPPAPENPLEAPLNDTPAAEAGEMNAQAAPHKPHARRGIRIKKESADD